MTNIFIPGTSIGGLTANTGTPIYPPIGMVSLSAASSMSEAQVQTTWEDAGTFSNLYTRIIATASAEILTLTYRVGAANGNQVITVAGSTTGEFTDAVNTDVAVAGNQINYKASLAAGGGNVTVGTIGDQFSLTSGSTVNKLMSSGSFSISLHNTIYANIAGLLSAGATEADVQFENKITATLDNLYAYLNANTIGVATIFSRVAGANGNLLISVSSGTTGVLEDTTDSDSLVSGNLINYGITTTAGTFGLTMLGSSLLSSASQTHYLISGAYLGTQLALTNTNYFISITGDLTYSSSTETYASMETGLSFTASNLEAYVVTNTLSGTAPITFRVNAGNGNQAISYATTVTGYMEDTTDTDAIVAATEIDYEIALGMITGTVNVSNIGFMATYPAGIVGYINNDGGMADMSGGMG